MAEHNITGKWGEHIAEEYLITKGYTVSQHNWRSEGWEIDLIAFKNDRIVFVEVKTRTDMLVDPLLAIDKKRIRHMTKAANAYVISNNIPHEIQFDILIIVGHPDSPTPPKIEHIPDAFSAPLHTVR